MVDTNRSLNASMRKLGCARCGVQFTCRRDDPAGCWCARLPPLAASALDPREDCLCRACLVGGDIGARVAR